MISRGQETFQVSKGRSEMGKNGLWDNIRKRKASGKKMREKGAPGAPTDKAFKNAQGLMNGGMVKYDKGGLVRKGTFKGCF